MGFIRNIAFFNRDSMQKGLVRAGLYALAAIAAVPLASAQELVRTNIAMASGSRYLGYLKETIAAAKDYLLNLSAPAKIGVIIALVIIAILIYLRTQDNASNNLRRAREMHSKAVELHEKGREAEAQQCYDKANRYREKAQEQAP